MSDHVYKKVTLMGSSAVSMGRAVNNAIEKSSKMIKIWTGLKL